MSRRFDYNDILIGNAESKNSYPIVLDSLNDDTVENMAVDATETTIVDTEQTPESIVDTSVENTKDNKVSDNVDTESVIVDTIAENTIDNKAVTDVPEDSKKKREFIAIFEKSRAFNKTIPLSIEEFPTSYFYGTTPSLVAKSIFKTICKSFKKDVNYILTIQETDHKEFKYTCVKKDKDVTVTVCK